MLRAIELQKAAIAKQVFLLLVVMGLTFAAHAEQLPVKIYTSADGLGSSFIDLPDARFARVHVVLHARRTFAF